MKKIFVLDTNIILHDHKAIYNFQDNDIILPIIVLEELDRFKRGNEEKNFQAREFVRTLDNLVGDGGFNGGVTLGKDRGKLTVVNGHDLSKEVKAAFSEHTADHRILSTALWARDHFKERSTILVSKDINLRLKAKSFGLAAEDYKNDKTINLEPLDRSIETINNTSSEMIDTLYNNGEVEIPKELQESSNNSSYQILKGESSSAIVRVDLPNNRFRLVTKKTVFGIKPRNSEQTVSIDMLLDNSVDLVAITGKAGTGKTLLALAAALGQHNRYENILLARPIVALSNRDLGYLPGDAKQKVAPYMMPLFDNLNVIKRSFSLQSNEYRVLEELQKEEKLIISPLAYIRGRSLSNTFFIIDEAQNLTPLEVKTIITRAGEGTKIVFTGDIQQIDSPYLDQYSNGLTYLTDRMSGQEIFRHINLVKGERSKLAEIASNIL